MFTHLHAHSFYSISDGLFSPKQWSKVLKDRGFKAHALTDHGTMAGLLPFYHSMKEEKLIPIMGVEFYFCDDPTDKTETGRATAHMILIAKNQAGWQNLMKLSRLSYELGFYYKPRVGPAWLKKYSEGLICLTACLGGVLSREIWREQDKKETMGLVKRFEQFRGIFGDDFYVEFQGHNAPDQALVNAKLAELAKLPGFKQAVTNDCHYINQEHAKIQGLIKASAFKNTEAAASYTHFDSLWLKSPRDVFETFREHHEYLPREFVLEGMRATQEITEKCAGFELPKKKYLPRYSKDETFFRKLTTEKLKEFLAKEDWRFGSRDDYVQRFKKEYETITKKGFQDYFLLVWDIIEWARKQKIMIGIGRGSAAGSLIAYLLGIVKINPLQYKLLFERFLNEHRDELPDIDLDFESLRRNEVKEYVFEKYGKEYVCEIGTYGRMMLKTAIIDFGKQFGYPQRDLVMITTNLGLDKTEMQSLDAATKNNPKLKSMMIEHPEYEHAVKVAIGQIKSQSIHPAGVLICSDKLETVTPLKTQKKADKTLTSKKAGENRVIVTQAEDKHVIGQGLVKMDFLGLKEYDIFRFTIENAAAAGYTHELTPDNYIDIIHDAEIAKPDKKVWKLFRAGKTEAVFQFGSDGMKQLLIDMKADNIADLVAAVALYRPGCLENGWHTQYCRRKHGDEVVEYVHPIMEEVLSDTYGVMIYQEQFMQGFHLLGDIQMVDADTLRSALGKKDAEKLKKFSAQFIEGAAKKLGQEDAEIVWDQMAKASGYLFNRSHSAVYAIVAYVSQWMKVHFPVAYWAAVVDWNCRKKEDELLVNKRAAAESGVTFLMPDINKSKVNFVIDPDAKMPRWSLSGISGIGEKTAQNIVDGQPYTSVEDFVKRVRGVNINNKLQLAFAGAFDSICDRKQAIDKIYATNKKKKKPKITDATLLSSYHAALGFFESKLATIYKGISKNVWTEEMVKETGPEEPLMVAGMVSAVKRIKTKKGDMMAKVTLVDSDESFELTVFPDQWSMSATDFKIGNVVQAAGYKSEYGGRHQVEVGVVEVITE